jgi:hypothetical protein
VTAAQPSSWAGATGIEVTPYAWIGALVVLLIAVGLLVGRGSPTERTGAWLAGFVAALGIGLPVGIAALADIVTNGDGDYFLDRNVLGAWVPLTVFVVAGLAARRAGVLGLACIVGIVCWSLAVQIRIVTTPAFQRDDWRAIAAELGDGRPTAVLVYPAYQAGALTRQRPELVEAAGSADVERVVLVLTGFEKPPSSFLVPPGFSPSAVRHVQHFVLREYLAPRPTRVGAADVARVPLEDADLTLLFER